MKYIYILVGGAAGSLLRFIISEYISAKYSSDFPVGIFFVNILGALTIGFLFGYLSDNQLLDDKLRFLLFIGLLGGFTTFSSFALENMRLIKDGLVFTSLLYIVLTNVLGIIVAFAGYFTALKIR